MSKHLRLVGAIVGAVVVGALLTGPSPQEQVEHENRVWRERATLYHQRVEANAKAEVDAYDRRLREQIERDRRYREDEQRRKGQEARAFADALEQYVPQRRDDPIRARVCQQPHAQAYQEVCR